MQWPPFSYEEEEGASTFLGASDDRPAFATSPASVDQAVEGDDDAFDEFAATYGGRGGGGGDDESSSSLSATDTEEPSSPTAKAPA